MGSSPEEMLIMAKRTVSRNTDQDIRPSELGLFLQLDHTNAQQGAEPVARDNIRSLVENKQWKDFKPWN